MSYIYKYYTLDLYRCASISSPYNSAFHHLLYLSSALLVTFYFRSNPQRVLRDAVSDPQLQHKQGARARLNNAVVSVALVERIMCRDQMLQVYNVGEKVLRHSYFLKFEPSL